MAPKFILIRGNAASGKTSLAKLLQAELGENTLLLSQDSLRRDMLHAHDGFDSPTIPLLLTLLEHGYRQCPVVILEGILHSGWHAPIFEKIAELYGEDCQAYYYYLSFEETVARHQTRAKSLEFGEEALRRWWLEKDYLTVIPETLFSANLSLSQAKQIILANLRAD